MYGIRYRVICMNLYVWIVPCLAGIILLFSILAKKMNWFLDFATRLCIGGLALYITREIMVRFSFGNPIGVNSATLSTVGVLGVSGFFLVLCIVFLKSI